MDQNHKFKSKSIKIEEQTIQLNQTKLDFDRTYENLKLNNK